MPRDLCPLGVASVVPLAPNFYGAAVRGVGVDLLKFPQLRLLFLRSSDILFATSVVAGELRCSQFSRVISEAALAWSNFPEVEK